MNGPFQKPSKVRSLRGWDLQSSKLKGIFTLEDQGSALNQDNIALFIECKNTVLTRHTQTLRNHYIQSVRNYLPTET